MITVHSDFHRLHAPKSELFRGQLTACFETPQRAELVLGKIKEVQLGVIRDPDEHGLAPIRRVHSDDYLRFLESAYRDWSAVAGDVGEALPHAFIGRYGRDEIPDNIYGKLGYYASDATTPITASTWQALLPAANVAMTAQACVQVHSCAFALTRPPGHHAFRDQYGGYCFLNFAAMTAQGFLDSGASQVAVLDLDFHHGNGTQDLFYDRSDVLYTSIHGDPCNEFPYFLGYSREIGSKEGEGFNLNIPLPPGTRWPTYESALMNAISRIGDSDASHLVVSLGVDTYEGDPISTFRLSSPDFLKIGRRIGEMGLPTLFVLEGGYAVEDIGTNVANVLSAFELTR
ncbi:MAG: histone deacetylase family protein [Planctomycetota bacterium]